MIQIKNFKSIEKVYNIKDITKEYILIKDSKQLRQIYVYKIEPLLLLDIVQDDVINITNIYVEILKQLDCYFQIILRNNKLNVDNYITQFNKQNNNIKYSNKQIYNEYVKDIKNKLDEEKIYVTDYYIVVSVENDNKIEEIDKVIFKLNKIGCKVERIKDKILLKDILYKSINKI